MNHIQVIPPAQQIPAVAAGPAPGLQPVQLGLSAETKLELLEYWRVLQQRKWAILSLATGLAVVAGAVSLAMTPIYKSTSTVLIEQSKAKVLSFDDLYSNMAGQSKEHYQTQIEILKSREVALKTVRALKLWNQPEFDPRKADDSTLGQVKQTLGMRDADPKWTEERLATAATKKLMKVTSVEPVRLSQLAKVSVEAEDKLLAQKLANELAAAFIDLDREARFKQAQSLNGWLEQRATELRSKVADAEKALQKYREEQGLVDLQGSAQTLASKQVDSVTQRLMEARNKRMQLESAYQGIVAQKGGDYRNVPAVVTSAGVQSAIQREAQATIELAQLTETLGSAHPRVQVAQSALADAKAQTRSQMSAVVRSVQEEYSAAKRAEGALQAELAQASGSVQDVNRKEFKLGILEREVASNKQLYDMFMVRAKELSSGSELQSAVARVVDPAVVAEIPVRPKKTQIVGVAFALGALLGALIAMLMNRLDNTIKGGDSTEAKLHLPVLTVLPLEEAQEGNGNLARNFIQAPSSHHAEAIRTARTGVLLSNIDQRHRVIMVTSSLPAEGKTSTATNLALALAQTKRTLLIDADMRKPMTGQRLGLPAGVKGLSNLVAGTAPLKDCVHQVEGSTLMVMPAGDIPPNPLELLLSQRFLDVLEHLKPQLDFIIIDSPPVELVSDGLALAPKADEVVFVVRAAQSTVSMARKSLGRLQRAGAKVQGVVVNGLDFDKADRYYGETTYGSYKSYGTYGAYGTYGTENAKSKDDAPETIQASMTA